MKMNFIDGNLFTNHYIRKFRMKKLIFLIFLVWIATQDPLCCSSSKFKIIDDPELDKVIKNVRDEFISTRTIPEFNRLDATIIIPTNDPNVYKRGSIGGSQIAYPAR